METVCSLVVRPSTSGRSLFGSSLRFLSRKTASPDSLRLRGLLNHGLIQPCFQSLAIIGDSPAITSDYLEVSTSGSTEKETRFQGMGEAQENEGIGEAQENEVEDEEEIYESQMNEICDQLIEVFMVERPHPADWRKILASSRNWSDYRPHFYKRCQDRADSESDPGMKHKILRLRRKLKDVDDDVQKHNDLLEVIRRDPSEIKAVVTKRRKDFTMEFFMHVRDVAQSYHENSEERDDLTNLGKACITAVKSYDNAQSKEDMKSAEAKFNDLWSSPTQDIASKRIEELAKRNQLNSFDSMMLTKAWSDAKESTLMKDEAVDMQYELYMGGLASLERMVPKDIRILKWIMRIEDPLERLAALNDAFTPAPEYETDKDDYLWTTPKELHNTAKTIIEAFNSCRRGSVAREARDLLQPRPIKRLEELKKIIEDHFL